MSTKKLSGGKVFVYLSALFGPMFFLGNYAIAYMNAVFAFVGFAMAGAGSEKHTGLAMLFVWACFVVASASAGYIAYTAVQGWTTQDVLLATTAVDAMTAHLTSGWTLMSIEIILMLTGYLFLKWYFGLNHESAPAEDRR
ncbi:hypothetical protein E0765_07480 [Sulfuricurvum sp. IAE1]|uniref:hypothetical protein n=1 Tax=Sulfuricurvum sp. IAE1 TaxID=2546102 RepID=UPI001051FFE5|nr:hypothetical protein [Sulfuricurvum sp. IAE1]TDA63668.1 hypothetical protein E0765_07480 [Sulfuricurvum sp. IAE1]